MSERTKTLHKLFHARRGAQSVRGRLAIDGDRLLCVHGEPAYVKFNAFNRLAAFNLASWGLRAHEVVDREWLEARCDDLRTWKALLKHPYVTNKFSTQLKKWKREIAVLRVQLSDTADVYRDLKIGKRSSNQLVLSRDDEETTQRLLDEVVAGGRSLPASWVHALRVVMWLRGEETARRALSAALPHLPESHIVDKTDEARQIATFLRRGRKQLRKDPSRFRERWVKAYRSWPIGIRLSMDVQYPEKGSDLRKQLKSDNAGCKKYLTALPPTLPGQMFADLAKLCCFDRSNISIPPAIFVEPDSDCFLNLSAFKRICNNLMSECHRHCYATLLELLSTGPRLPRHEIGNASAVLSAGTSAATVRWFVENELMQFVEGCEANLEPLRDLFELCSAFDPDAPQHKWRSDVCGSIRSQESVVVFQHVRDWLVSHPNHVLRPKFIAEVRNMLSVETLPAGLRSFVVNDVEMWRRPAERSDYARLLLPECASIEAAERLLNLLGHYQTTAGESVRLPKAIRRLLGFSTKRKKELANLRMAADQGTLSDKASQRLQHLELSQYQVHPFQVVRELEKAVAETSVRAFNRIATAALRSWWKKSFPNVTAPASQRDTLDVCDWFNGRLPEQQTSIKEVFRTWMEHGAMYRKYLAGNQMWFRWAREKGIRLDEWLGTRESRFQIDDEPFRVAVSTNPLATMRMGSLFDTCLCIREGENRHSVLPNIYDANKAVIYVYDTQSVVRGRLLVAISESGALVRYHNYVNSGDETFRKRIREEVERFCGHWAFDVDIPLSNEGEPARLSHSWYDDGVEEWQPIARSERAQPDLTRGDVISSSVLA